MNLSPTITKLLAAKAALMAELQSVPKLSSTSTGNNSFQYAGELDLLMHIRPLMLKHGLDISPVGAQVERRDQSTSTGKASASSGVTATYLLAHSSGEWMQVQVCGSAMDGAGRDTSQAMTDAYKTALFQAFMLPKVNEATHKTLHKGPTQHADRSNSKPAPQSKSNAPAGDGHHPSFNEHERKKFCAALMEHHGLRYEDDAYYCEQMGNPRPSQMTAEQRQKHWDWLGRTFDNGQTGADKVRRKAEQRMRAGAA